jgi:hypothetical protein
MMTIKTMLNISVIADKSIASIKIEQLIAAFIDQRYKQKIPQNTFPITFAKTIE